MSTEIALQQANTFAVDPTGGRLVSWAAAAASAAKLGTELSRTSFVPAVFRGKPEECAAAILYGDEIGLTPMQALQSVYVVSGKPGLYSRSMLAIVLAAGHEVRVIEKTDNKVVVEGRRRGSDHWEKEIWTNDRASKAGYNSNKKYLTDPQSMLLARATADICRRVAPDALAGLTLTVEEIELEEAEQVSVTVTRADKPTKVQRAKAPDPVEPEFDDVVEAEIVELAHVPGPEFEQTQETKPTAPMISPAQTKMLGALMNELHITDRTQALIYCNDVIGREITSRNELTKSEASSVIEALNADKTAQADTFPNEPSLDGE